MVFIIAFYQLFVDENYNYLNWKVYFSPQFFKNIIQLNKKSLNRCLSNSPKYIAVKNNVIEYNDNQSNAIIKFVLDDEEILTSQFYLSAGKDKLAYLTLKNGTYIVNIKTIDKSYQQKVVIENIDKLSIIQWRSVNDDLYLAYKKDSNWSIGYLPNNSKKIEILVEKINFNEDVFPQATQAISQYIVYPECIGNCRFTIYDLETSGKRNIIVANEESNKDVERVILIYFDDEARKLIYSLPQWEGKTLYISDFSGYLWHNIFLEPAENNRIEFKGILKDQQRKKILAYSKVKNQAYLYDIDYIGLKTVDMKKTDELIDDQVDLTHQCLVFKKSDKEYWIKDIDSFKERLIDNNSDYFQLL